MRLIILILALAAAGGAGFLVMQLSQPRVLTQTVTRDQLVVEEREVSEVEVLTVTRDFAIGERIKANDLVWAPWPKSSVVGGFFVKTTAPASIQELTGAVVKQALYKGEAVIAQKVVRKGEQGLLASLMDPGMRAVSIEISAESASGGFILPNDRVDIILAYEQSADPERGIPQRSVATTIVTNVRVLAIDQNFSTDEKGEASQIGRTATLEVSPSEVELLALAQQKGEVSLSLRPLDHEISGTDRNARTELLGLETEPPSTSITIIRNSRPAPAGVGGN
jgi:pilus assembly protein CpaB